MKLTEKIFYSAVRHPYIATMALVLFLLLVPAWLRPLHTPDEGRYAEVSREVLTGGHWLVPHINGVPHLSKPPLYYDLSAVAFLIFGQNAFAIRLVSIGAFLCGLFFSIRWAKRWGNAQAAALTGLIGATIFQSAATAQFADLNMLLTLWVTLGLLYFFEALENPQNPAAWYVAWLFLALGFLTKGPPALFIPAVILILYRIFSGRSFRISARHWFGGILLFCIVTFPWYFWILLREGKNLWSFWTTDIMRRTIVSEKMTHSIPGYYVVVLLVGGACWSFRWLADWLHFRREKRRREGKFAAANHSFLPGRIWRVLISRARELPRAELWLICWVAGTILPFTILLTMRISYIQPCYPAFGLLLALYYVRKGVKITDRRLQHTFTASALSIFILGWGLAFYGAAVVSSSSLKTPRVIGNYLEDKWIAERLRDFGERPYKLIQYDHFNPLYDFTTRRCSILVKEKIHKQWHLPPEMSASKQQLAKWVEENRPMVIVMKSKRLKDFADEPWQNLKILFAGRRYALLVTPPLTIPQK